MNSIALQALSLLSNLYVTETIPQPTKDMCGKMIGKLLAMVEKDIDVSWETNYSSLIHMK